MVPAYSVKVSRVLTYSGSCCAISHFVYGAITLSGRSFQDRSTILDGSRLQSEPRSARTPVWALPRSLAATYGIDVSFSSSGYLDVSVHRVPSSHPIYSDVGDRSLSCRVSPFRYPRINRYLLLPVAFRSLSRLSSALSAKASTLRSFLLHLSSHNETNSDSLRLITFVIVSLIQYI